MSMIRTSNPLLTAERFAPNKLFGNFAEAGVRRSTMTLQGTVNATFILLGLCVATAVAAWTLIQSNPALLLPCALGGSVVTLVLSMVMFFKPGAAPFVAPLGAIAQGAMAGGISVFWSMYAARASAKDGSVIASLSPALVLQAALLTAAIAGALLIAYSSRLIKPSENFKLGVIAATGGLAVFMVLSMLLSAFGIRIPYLWENGIIGIGFTAAIVVLASLNLVLDFDFIEEGSRNGLPRYMEWYGAFGLLVTLVWLYISLLRLLAQIAARRN